MICCYVSLSMAPGVLHFCQLCFREHRPVCHRLQSAVCSSSCLEDIYWKENHCLSTRGGIIELIEVPINCAVACGKAYGVGGSCQGFAVDLLKIHIFSSTYIDTCSSVVQRYRQKLFFPWDKKPIIYLPIIIYNQEHSALSTMLMVYL